MTSTLPTFGPTGPPVADDDVDGMAVVRLAVILSPAHLRTALAASYAEMGESRSLANLDISEIRREVEGYLGANALMNLYRETAAADAQPLSPDRAQWLAALDEAITRSYAVPATAARPTQPPQYGKGTVTLHAEDYGDVTVPEPAWCVGHESTPGDLRADILHQGPDVALVFRGQHIGDASLVQSPFSTAEIPELCSSTPGVSVSLLGRTLDPVQLYDFAATLDTYADQLRDLADQLHTLLGGGES